MADKTIMVTRRELYFIKEFAWLYNVKVIDNKEDEITLHNQFIKRNCDVIIRDIRFRIDKRFDKLVDGIKIDKRFNGIKDL